MGCGITMIKYLLFLANLLIALAGLAIIAVGAYIVANVSEFTQHLANPQTYAIILIILGSIIFVISFFGCCGAIRESHCMVVTYFIFLLVLIIVQIIIGVLCFMYLPQVKDVAARSISELFNKNDNTSKEVFNSIETTFHCCGAQGPQGYPSGNLPRSCCPVDVIQGGYCEMNVAYQKGCMYAVKESLDKYGKGLAIAFFCIAGIEALVSIFSLCLANSIRNAERRSHY